MGLDIGVHGHVRLSSGRLIDGGSESGAYATRAAPAKGIWSIGAIRTGAPGRGAWIICPLPM